MNVQQLIESYFEAFNAHDAEALLATLSDDVIHEINEGETQTGIGAFRSFKAHMDATYREQITDLCIMVNGDRGAAEFTCSGTYLKTDGSLPEAHGQTYSIRAAAFFEARDGKLSRVTSSYNLRAWIEAISS